MLVLVCVCLTACIDEDLSDCPVKDTRLWVKFLDNTESNRYKSGVNTRVTSDRAVLYIFDEYSNFVVMRDIYKPKMNVQFEIVDWQKHLAIGKSYKFFVWFYNGSPYSTNPIHENFSLIKPNVSEAQLLLNIPKNRVVDFELPILLYGNHSEKIDLIDPVIDIILTQNTNIINFTVDGLDNTLDTYEFLITDNNGVYDFDNNIVSLPGEGLFSYITRSKFSLKSSVLLSTSHILKLQDGRTPLFTLRNSNTGETLYPSYPGQENNLIKMIQKAYKNNIDFDRKHEFDVKISFDTKMGATVIIDGWNMNESDNEITP